MRDINFAKKKFSIIGLELTNYCIMRCIMCPRTYRMNREKGHMSMELFKKIIDEYADISPLGDAGYGPGTIWLHLYGESLLSPIFDEAISYTNYKGLKPMLSLNPLALTKEKMERLLNAKPYLLYLMLDGCDEESFSNLRGVSGKYEESVKNTLMFLELKDKLKSDVRTFIVCVDIPGYNDIIDKTQSFWKIHGAEAIEDFLRKPFCDWNGSIKEITDFADNWSYGKCVNPWHTISITWDGIVVPCCYDYDKFYPLGDVNLDSLIDIWNGEKMRNLREEFSNGNITNMLCKTCYQGGKTKTSSLVSAS